MSEKPILFSAPMVQAILAGKKTQTRRVIKLPIDDDIASINPDGQGNWVMWAPTPATNEQSIAAYPDGGGWPCPYGNPGGMLWVKEAWRTYKIYDLRNATWMAEQCLAAGYKRAWAPIEYQDGSRCNWQRREEAGRRRSARFMPRWASRITLRVVDVRVERLQDISEADICAELGCALEYPGPGPAPYRRDLRGAFAGLWDGINAKRGYTWASNPWVWAVTFEQVKEP